jgi:hypothetical protein
MSQKDFYKRDFESLLSKGLSYDKFEAERRKLSAKYSAELSVNEFEEIEEQALKDFAQNSEVATSSSSQQPQEPLEELVGNSLNHLQTFELSPEDKALASNFVKDFNLLQEVHKEKGGKIIDLACYLGSSFPIIGQGCFIAANSARQAVIVKAIEQLGSELLTKQTTIKYFKTNLERELKVLKTRIEEEKEAQEKKI